MHITPLTTEHYTEWATLLAICFDRTPQDMLKLLKWLANMGEIVAYGAWDTDRLVAQYTCLMRCLSVQTTPTLAGMSINMAVHPDYRGQGLVKKVSAPVYDDVQARGAIIGMGFSNAEGVKVDRHSKSYGYQVIGRMQSLVSWLSATHYSTVQLTDTFPNIDHLPHLDCQTDNIQFTKSWQSLSQRYADHPFRDYQYGCWYENNRLQGVVIYREIERFGVKGVALLDAHGTQLDHLIRCWGSTMYQNGKRFIHTLITPSGYVKWVIRNIYTTLSIPYSNTPYYLTVKPLTKDGLDMFQHFDSWDCIGGDIL